VNTQRQLPEAMRAAKAEAQPGLTIDQGQDRAGDQDGGNCLRRFRRNQETQVGDLIHVQGAEQPARHQNQGPAEQDG